MSRPGGTDRGAVAVEFALVLPLLLALVFGMVSVGGALRNQIVLSGAAREGARLAALGQPDTAARTQAAAAADGPVIVTVTWCPPHAGPSSDAKVTVTDPYTFAAAALAGIPAKITLTATAVMPCEP